MASPLVRTKLFIPRLRRGVLPRSRLSERLDDGAETKLTLVSAPAGFGKTTSLALGFASRMFEASVILIGVVSLLAVVTLRQDAGGTGSGPATLATTGQALVAVRDYTFQFGPNLCAAMNALLFGTLLYRSRLVPRIIPTVGLIGAPLLIAATVATVLGLTEQGSVWFVGGAMIAAWELSVGVYMVVKGFKPAPITATGPE